MLRFTIVELTPSSNSPQAVVSSALLGFASLLVAPSLLAAGGAATVTFLLLQLAYSTGWEPEDGAPGKVPLRTVQSK